MTELQRYLAEEVAEDHADGIITRREAVRRLGLLGVSGAGATTLLGRFAGGGRGRGGDARAARRAVRRVGAGRHAKRSRSPGRADR